MPPSENFLKILTDQFGDFRDSQLQIEEILRENERKGVLSDTGLDQGRGFETADEFNLRLDAVSGQVTDGPDETVVIPDE